MLLLSFQRVSARLNMNISYFQKQAQQVVSSVSLHG